jgi:hypothetical protein
MILIEPLEHPRYLIPERARKRLTQVAFCLTVIPYAYWPVKANIVKGCMDSDKTFHPLVKSHERVFLSRLEFKDLLVKDPSGQTAFKLELKDLVKLIREKMNLDGSSKRAAKKKTG